MNEIKFPPCELTKEQEKKWTETRVALSWYAPGFTHLFMTMLNPEKSRYFAYFTKSVQIAATDGFCMMANPDTFFEYEVLTRVAACGHEILHAALNHPKLWQAWDKAGFITYPDGTKLPFDFNRMQIVGDHIVNDMLVNSKIGKVHPTWWHNPAFIHAGMSCAEAYRVAYEASPPPPKPPTNKPGQPCKDGDPSKGQGNGPPQPGQQPDPLTMDSNQSSFDEHLKPGEAQSEGTPQANGERSEEAWGVAIAAAAKIEEDAGKDKGGITKVFKEMLEPVVDWTDVLRAMVSRKLGADRYDWQRPDRRLIVRDIYAPSRSSFDTGTVVVAVDTSGSVINEMDMFLREISTIFSDMRPRELIILWCDAAVHDVDNCDSPEDLEAIRRRGARGGGGTKFRPVFDWVRDNNVYPDLMVYLTDGQCWDGFGAAPNYPTIWGNIRPESRYPWGEVVQVPKQVRKQAA